jgi:hypothetical protein
LPAARLPEFDAEFTKLSASETPDWSLSVLSGADPMIDAVSIQAFNVRHSKARIVSVEAKATNPADIDGLVSVFPPDTEIWIEAAAAGDVMPFISAIQAAGHRSARTAVVGAKIRTGGTTPEAFPSAVDIARFMQACRTIGVIFKATAGLHHPLRGEFPLTYQSGSPRGLMFGFLNIFLAATLVHTGGSEADTVALLDERDAGKFTVSPDAITWNGRRFTTTQLATARKTFCRSFGSCSFTEPIDGLRLLHWL